MSFPGPETIHTATLGNGLRVWIYENFASETIAVDGYLPGGAAAEQPQQAGLANLTAGLLRRGTQTHSFDEINELLDAAGVSMHFGVGRHVLSFEGKAMVEDLDLLLELLTESLAQPAFSPDQLDKLRARVLTNIREREDSTRSMASLIFREHLFSLEHPYGRSLSGYAHTVSAIDRDAIVDFYRRTIGPAQGIVAIAGALDAETIIDKLEKTLGRWRQPEASPLLEAPPEVELEEKVEVNHPISGKSQSDLVLGWPGIERLHADYFPVLLCNSILGRFGMGGRLGFNVREKQGMAYYAYSTFGANRGAGAWYVYAGVNPANLSQTISTILHEIERIRETPVSDDELADVKANLTGSLPLRLETNAGVAGNLLTMAWYDLGLDYLERYPQWIDVVTKEDILRVARTYLDPERYVLSIAGPERSD